MEDGYPPENRTERVQCSDLWFVVHRVTDQTQRAACYLCGWWSQGMLTSTSAMVELREHVATIEHHVAVREFVTADTNAIAEGQLGAQDGHTCPHCGRTTWHPQDIAKRYCVRCHHFCDDVAAAAAEPPPPAPPRSEERRPSPHPGQETGWVRIDDDQIRSDRPRWPWQRR